MDKPRQTPPLLCLLIGVCLFLSAGAAKAEPLPVELRGVEILPRFVPSDFPEAGRLHTVSGRVVVLHRATGEAFYGRAGHTVYENDALITLEGALCRIRFFSNDVVSMAPDSRFAVERVPERREESRRETLFGLLRGKAMFYALRLFRYRDRAFEVVTPTAVVGVRGTKFGLHVFPVKGSLASGSAGLRVADARPLHLLLSPRNDSKRPETGTIVACADGRLEVTDRGTGRTVAAVGPSEVFNTHTEEKAFDPDNRVLKGIQAATEEGGTQVGEDRVEEGDTGEPAGMAAEERLLATGETVLNTTREETGLDAVEGFETLFEPPGQWYFAAMLRNLGTGFIEDVFVGGADLGAAAISYVPSMIDFPDRFWFNEQTDTVTEVRMAGVTKDANVTWTRTTLGRNAYMAWGHWTSDMSFTGSGPFQFINKMWWVDGDVNDRSLPKGVITYQGGAHGTYSSPTETHDMTGSFSCRVDFDASSHEVQDFAMNVAGGGKTASIHNPHASFDPTFKSDGIGFFMFTDGTWTLNGSTPTDKECQGIVYGGGRGIGGSCGMYNSSTQEGYAGIFHGQGH